MTDVNTVAAFRETLRQVKEKVLDEIAFTQATKRMGTEARAMIETWPRGRRKWAALADVDSGISELAEHADHLLDELSQVERDLAELATVQPQSADPTSEATPDHP
jgi:hypothetical protein